MALDLGTDIAARRRDDRILRIAAPLLGAADVISVDDLDPRRGSKRNHYVPGTAALLRGDVGRFGQLLTRSHLSLRDDYEVSGAELDMLVDISANTPGVLGARLTGAGFGGCAIAIAITDRADSALKTIVERYRQVTGLPGNGFACAASDGTHIRWTAKQ